MKGVGAAKPDDDADDPAHLARLCLPGGVPNHHGPAILTAGYW